MRRWDGRAREGGHGMQRETGNQAALPWRALSQESAFRALSKSTSVFLGSFFGELFIHAPCCYSWEPLGGRPEGPWWRQDVPVGRHHSARVGQLRFHPARPQPHVAFRPQEPLSPVSFLYHLGRWFSTEFVFPLLRAHDLSRVFIQVLWKRIPLYSRKDPWQSGDRSGILRSLFLSHFHFLPLSPMPAKFPVGSF